MKLGDIALANKTVLAPMRGVSCPSFRILCKKYGASLLSTQVFWSWEKEIWENRLANEFSGLDHPLSVQIGGNNPEELKESVLLLEDHADIIDFNACCPHKRECGHKSGSFLLLHLNQLERAVRTVLDTTRKPVTVKIRLGWDSNRVNAVETAKLLEDLGVSAVTVHARTRQQLFKDKADIGKIKVVKEKVNIPVIGNGDIDSGQQAERMLKSTNCDAVMIGRASKGNPFIFKQVNTWLDRQVVIKQDFDKKRKDFIEFSKYYQEIEKNRSFTEFTTQAFWFLKGFLNVNKLKEEIDNSQTIEDIIAAYQNFDSKSVISADRVFKNKTSSLTGRKNKAGRTSRQ
ncbi:MAG: tRNA dihydrouridine synthase [Candidatus Odinarchaeota archaeon]